MIIFGILLSFLEVAALSVRGRSRRLGHPRCACVKVMYFRRFVRHSSDGESASSENVSTALGAGPRILESRTGRRPSQIGLRVDLKAQTTLHTYVSLILPFEESMTCAGNPVNCTILATVRVPFVDTQHTTVKSQ